MGMADTRCYAAGTGRFVIVSNATAVRPARISTTRAISTAQVRDTAAIELKLATRSVTSGPGYEGFANPRIFRSKITHRFRL